MLQMILKWDVCSFYGLPHYDLWGNPKPQPPCRETIVGECSDCSFRQPASRSQMALLTCSRNPHRKLQCTIRCCKTLSVPPAFEFASGLQRRAGVGLSHSQAAHAPARHLGAPKWGPTAGWSCCQFSELPSSDPMCRHSTWLLTVQQHMC